MGFIFVEITGLYFVSSELLASYRLRLSQRETVFVDILRQAFL
jgi:hypothetical protein